MNRMLARLSTIAAAAPLAAAVLVGGTAHAQSVSVTLPGCWGAGGTIYCNVTLSAQTPHPNIGVVYVKGCAGDCYDIPVQWVDPNSPSADLCYSYQDGNGYGHSGCGTDVTRVVTLPSLQQIALDLTRCGGTSASFCTYE
jgi:hypothetical protein